VSAVSVKKNGAEFALEIVVRVEVSSTSIDGEGIGNSEQPQAPSLAPATTDGASGENSPTLSQTPSPVADGASPELAPSSPSPAPTEGSNPASAPNRRLLARAERGRRYLLQTETLSSKLDEVISGLVSELLCLPIILRQQTG
jgi:hypothetical protein